MTGALFHLGGLCVRRRWIVLAVWLLIVRRAGDLGARARARTSTTTSRCPAPTAARRPTVGASGSRRRRTGPTRSCCARRTARSSAPPSTRQPIDDTVAAFKKDPAIRSATQPAGERRPDLLSKDKSIGYIALNLRPSPSELTLDEANRIVALADPARKAGLEVGFGGYLGQKVSKPDTHSAR